MKSETENFTQQFNDMLIAIQKEYEQRRNQLLKSMTELEREHAEWMNLDYGEKLMRMKLVTAFLKNGEIESVYSEKVKSRAKDIRAEIFKNADEAKKRLKAKFRNPETPL